MKKKARRRRRATVRKTNTEKGLSMPEWAWEHVEGLRDAGIRRRTRSQVIFDILVESSAFKDVREKVEAA